MMKYKQFRNLLWWKGIINDEKIVNDIDNVNGKEGNNRIGWG